ncbi:class II D-tagatose-bisphosphate aldolase, non-catalytic subunit [Treponema sp. HNW]|uniref:class II D-tagatose-bisphosphate aldolase non-catalytic subunit n=1 Tax=Treponema sp. HNW TaxID=3116654 RepID=UPI003D0EAC45
MDIFKNLIETKHTKKACGLYSVCSSHPAVLDAAFMRAAKSKHPVLIEATANQVNQYGGYTGMTPEDFGENLRQRSKRFGVSEELFIYGGDHLGPFPWRNKKAADAMKEAVTMIKAFVAAGASKIHLDASMPLADDFKGALDPAIAAQRAAELCLAAEEEFAHNKKLKTPPVYVIGTEVPIPGGTAEQGKSTAPIPTKPEDFHETIRLHKEAFACKRLTAAWSRVIAAVVQPGVEFGAMHVYPYRRKPAKELMSALHDYPSLVFEGHSTDYQQEQCLRMLVEDGVAILKVGPGLTFAMREALFGLAYIDMELSGNSGKPDLIITLEKTMEFFPDSWKDYYNEDNRVEMLFGYSDRVRYYWDNPIVMSSVRKLMESLSHKKIPVQLISQYIPHLEPAFFSSSTNIREIPSAVIDSELKKYERACLPSSV